MTSEELDRQILGNADGFYDDRRPVCDEELEAAKEDMQHAMEF